MADLPAVQGDVMPTTREPFTPQSGTLAARQRADRAKLARERRREQIDSALEIVAEQAAKLHVDLILDADEERSRAKHLGIAPDKDTMDRGLKAAKVVFDRLAPVVHKVEGEVHHSHLLTAVAEAVAANKNTP